MAVTVNKASIGIIVSLGKFKINFVEIITRTKETISKNSKKIFGNI